MTHEENRVFLIRFLLAEQPRYRGIEILDDWQGQKDLLRTLMNVRMPGKLSDEYIKAEREYLSEKTKRKGASGTVSKMSELRQASDT